MFCDIGLSYFDFFRIYFLPRALMKFAAALVLPLLLSAVPASASLNSESFARDFREEALKTFSFTSSGRVASFYKQTDDRGYGFRLNGSLDATDKAASLATGMAFGGHNASADLERDAKLTTLMVSGTYDLPLNPRLLLRPYLLAGAGLAVYDTSGANMQPDQQGTNLVPVFKLGGGLAFRMGQVMDLTFSYKAGLASTGTAGRNSDNSAMLQMFDIALKYRF
jgi:hypothetical protein